jgi:hypothetical protein
MHKVFSIVYGTKSIFAKLEKFYERWTRHKVTRVYENPTE